MSIEITDVKINTVNLKDKSGKPSKTKAFARIIINECFCVDGLKVIDGSKGLFVGMPSKETKKDSKEYVDICFPINSETRKVISDAVMKAYKDTQDGIFDD